METTEIKTLGEELQRNGAEVVVTDVPSYAAAGEFLLGIKRYTKRVADTFGPMKRAALDTHKEIVAKEKEHMQPALDAETAVKSAMMKWKRIEDARAAEQRRAAEEVARKEAERRAEEEQLARAQAAAEQGDDETAEKILDAPAAPVPVMPVAPPPAVPDVAGISGRKKYCFEVIDVGSIPREYMKVDTVKLGQLARMHKEQAKLDGVRFYVEDSLSVKA